MPKIPIDECPAGPAMDAAVAEALGWHWHDGRGTAGPSYWETADGDTAYIWDFEPSTDIVAAWELIENLKKRRPMVTIQLDGWGSTWICWVDNNNMNQWEKGETAPLTICRAFLKANGVEYVEVLHE